MLNAGDVAPDFALPASAMELIQLADYRGQHHVVLYFFNKDHTPGGLAEAIEFSDRVREFARHDTVILGVSLDECLAHEVFREQEGIEFELLSDTEGEVSERYHALKKWEANGVVRYGIERSTFVIGKDGVIRHAFYHVAPKGHAAQILSLVQSLG
ncbi:peroxiredoxin [Chitiniphilus purpureus]|uniref:thioredoxin-dependent peroxiredoxin n=1 Tax=Chitiniphilus purpureus TaxID=2981137 RepID=A0ABY6DRP5_9NEIS|nr:peroxiredoxin [Chitiniphilus sp. CD1]UXY14578.1 peroxiredoxin [Chitiniphilus sp. CD1]